MDPAIALRVAREVPRGTATRYPVDDFQVYHPPFVDRIVVVRIAFFSDHLDPG